MGRDELRVGAYGDQIHGDVEVLYGGEAKFMASPSSPSSGRGWSSWSTG